MEQIINSINNSLIQKKINDVNKTYFYNRNTIFVDLIQSLNKLNEPLIKKLNNMCSSCFSIINYEEVIVKEDCNNNRLINCKVNLTNNYNNILLNIEIFMNNNVSNINNVKIHNSEDTNLLNQSLNSNISKTYNQDISNTIPVLDYTILETDKSCIKTNVCEKNKYKNYNNWIVFKDCIPNFYKCNYESFPELSEKNDIFQGHRGLKGAYSL